MPSHPTPSSPYRDAHDPGAVIHASEPLIGYESALPYLLRGHDGARCGSDGRAQGEPLSSGQLRSAGMAAAGRDF